MLLGGEGNAMHVPFLMWSAFAVPVGWGGLCKFLADGQWRLGILALMGLILSAGIVSTWRDFKRDLRMGEFSVREIEELRAACSGEEKIGYFTPEERLEPPWMEPILSSWAALAECKFIRLNRLQADKSGWQRHYWEESAPAYYAGALGLEWSNTADIIIGFARRFGIRMVMESKDHPVPDYILPLLDLQHRTSVFTLYKITEVPVEK